MLKFIWTSGERHLSLSNLVLPIAVSALVGCKPSNDVARTKSLDNFAAGDGTKLTFNSCSGSSAVHVEEKRLLGSAQENAAMRKALSAVPVELQDAFFKDLQGTIKPVNNPLESCGSTQVSAATADDLLACWRGGESGIVIYIKAEADSKLTERNIKHSLVRMMGYVLTDVILKTKRAGSEAAITDNPSLVSVKRDVAAAFTSDTEKSKDFRIPAALKSDTTKYQDATFAEAFDSYYCSATSQATLAKNFPQTFEIFSEIAALLPQGLAGTLDTSPAQAAVQTSPAVSKSSDKFSLWGRWGWGNGPLRQGFSNWSNYRSNGGGFMNFRRWGNGGGFFFNR